MELCLASELILYCTANQIKPLSFQTSRGCSILVPQYSQHTAYHRKW